jgi:hypothetical protein
LKLIQALNVGENGSTGDCKIPNTPIDPEYKGYFVTYSFDFQIMGENLVGQSETLEFEYKIINREEDSVLLTETVKITFVDQQP